MDQTSTESMSTVNGASMAMPGANKKMAGIFSVIALVVIAGVIATYSFVAKKPSSSPVATNKDQTTPITDEEINELEESLPSQQEPEPTPVSTPTTPSPAAEPTTTPATTTTNYKNGTYSSTGNYSAPSGAESIGVTITLKDNIITDTSATANAQNPVAKRYQEIFIQNFKSLVIGKNINTVQLDKVAGSSLTPDGFNDALSKIKLQAKS